MECLAWGFEHVSSGYKVGLGVTCRGPEAPDSWLDSPKA